MLKLVAEKIEKAEFSITVKVGENGKFSVL
jgi:hypothetical protein